MNSTTIPEISVIIPTYQHAKELPLCLESVFAQNFKDFEVIVVNDGSKDDTLEVLKPFMSRITLIDQENKGGNAARNRGFDASKGKLVLFCDADVIMRPEMLAKMRQALADKQSASYVYSSFKFGWKSFHLWPFDAERLKKLNFIHTTSMIRREHFPRFDEKIRRLQDWDLWLTMLEAGHVGYWIPEYLFTCLPHQGGISTWVPGWFYRVPWSKFGIRIDTVEKFHIARRIMVEKHHLWKPQ
jgi:glycosyltransferase involved in cell wall biosynthesis